MEDVVVSAGTRPKPNKVMLAAAMAVVCLGVFVVGFYYLGGTQLLEGALTSLGVAVNGSDVAPAPTGDSGAPAAASVASSVPLPDGVDTAFAQRIFAEQLDSNDNIRKLVEGEITAFHFGEATTTAQGVEVPITAKFKDGSTGPGVLGLEQHGGNWFFSFIDGSRDAATGGLADTVSLSDGNEDVRFLDDATVDQAVIRTMLSEQVKSQSVLAAIADGSLTDIAVGKPKPSVGTATLPVELAYKSGSSATGSVVCIKKRVDGADMWFITSFSR